MNDEYGTIPERLIFVGVADQSGGALEYGNHSVAQSGLGAAEEEAVLAIKQTKISDRLNPKQHEKTRRFGTPGFTKQLINLL